MKIGALFAGYGGLDLAVELALPGAEVAWVSEFDKAPSKILAHRYPNAPNHGDVTKIDWTQVEPVDVLTGGYPCQPFSIAGERLGTDDPRHLWPFAVEAISELRPRLCIFENVQGHITLGLDHVLRDLDLLGYEVRWHMLSAASVGAPHRRNRVFILAWERNERHVCRRPDRRRGVHRDSGVGRIVPGPTQSDHDGQGNGGHAPHGADVWREDRRPAPGHGPQPRIVQLAPDRSEGLGPDRDAPPTSPGEGGGGRPGARLPGDGGRRASPAERTGEVVGPDAGARIGVRQADTGGQSPWPRCSCADIADRISAGDSPLGGLVGAGGRPLRPGRVRGEAPDERTDDLGSHLRDALTLLKTPTSQLAVNGGSQHPDKRKAGGHGPTLADEIEHLLPTPVVNDMGRAYTPETWDEWTARLKASHGNGNGHGASLSIEALRYGDVFGPYAPAVRRWASLTRPVPQPTEPTGKGGAHRLSARFVEWLMGLPDGWVTEPAIGISRNDQLKALGNGVVPQQAATAIRHLLTLKDAP